MSLRSSACLLVLALPCLAQSPGKPAASARPASMPDEVVSTLFLHPERLPLRDGGHVTIERGMLLVPVVRSEPSSRQIAVEVYRFRAAEGAKPGTPPIFQLHGGPGWPGLRSTLEERGGYEQQILPMTQVADLVVVGQRGIGSSVPNTTCVAPELDGNSADLTEAQSELLVQEACRACRAYWEEQGYDLSGFNVIEAAADVDDVRRHLGYDRITLWGGSFGSHWSMAVMRYFPEGVARAVLTGMEGPDHTYDMPTGVLNALARMAGEAERSEALADHIPEGGLIEALRVVIESVDEEPVEVELRNPRSGQLEPFVVDGDGLRQMALGYTTRVNSRRGVGAWPADVLQLYHGDFEGVARALAQRRANPDLDLPTASFFMLDCGSGISPEREAILNADPAAKIVGNLGSFYQLTCPLWDADLGAEFRAGFTTTIPTVIVHGTWDVSTPFENALELLDTFEAGQFVVVDTGSHGALGEAMGAEPSFRAALMDFVATGNTAGLPGEVRLPPISWAPPR